MSTAFGVRPSLTNEKFFPATKPVAKSIVPKVEPKLTLAEWKRRSREFEELRRRETIVAAIESALKSPEERPYTYTMQEIAEQVAVQHGLSSWRDLHKNASSQMHIYVYPRQEAMWRIRKETQQSLPAIGRFFGGYDHTTVLHAIRRVEARRKGDAC